MHEARVQTCQASTHEYGSVVVALSAILGVSQAGTQSAGSASWQQRDQTLDNNNSI
jgi:hypothetical protein